MTDLFGFAASTFVYWQRPAIMGLALLVIGCLELYVSLWGEA